MYCKLTQSQQHKWPRVSFSVHVCSFQNQFVVSETWVELCQHGGVKIMSSVLGEDSFYILHCKSATGNWEAELLLRNTISVILNLMSHLFHIFFSVCLNKFSQTVNPPAVWMIPSCHPQRDSWEQSVPESVTQVEAPCTDSLPSIAPSMSSPEPPGSPSQYRSPSRGSSMGTSSQPYTLHSLEDAHYHSLTSSPYPLPSTSFPCPPYMSSPISDLMSKMVNEEASDSLATESEAHSCWPKEDGVNSWSTYEIRRAFWTGGSQNRLRLEQ